MAIELTFPQLFVRFGDDSCDSQDDSPGGEAVHKTTQHLQAWTGMEAKAIGQKC